MLTFMVYCCTKPIRKTGAASILGRAGRFGRLSDRAGFNRFSELIGRFGRLSDRAGFNRFSELIGRFGRLSDRSGWAGLQFRKKCLSLWWSLIFEVLGALQS